jgi:hypothetical protein
MIELLIAACLNTAQCKDFSLQYSAYEMSMMNCTIHGQSYIAEWKTTHPDWTVERWTCGYVAPGRADL